MMQRLAPNAPRNMPEVVTVSARALVGLGAPFKVLGEVRYQAPPERIKPADSCFRMAADYQSVLAGRQIP